LKFINNTFSHQITLSRWICMRWKRINSDLVQGWYLSIKIILAAFSRLHFMWRAREWNKKITASKLSVCFLKRSFKSNIMFIKILWKKNNTHFFQSIKCENDFMQLTAFCGWNRWMMSESIKFFSLFLIFILTSCSFELQMTLIPF
jgi:hypothetical protein